ncbi:MAG: YihY/virulence factor BrkB family protein [Victivallales bacterium]|nr:YihY/virulence factor BrkB family protein [Victivallales bacterium]
MKYYNIIKTFLAKDLWNVDVQQLPFAKRFGYSFLRMLIIAVRGFLEDRCTLQASALTYITLVSLVPILAITLAFCKGIGLQRKLMETIGLEMKVKMEPDEHGVMRREVVYNVIPKEEDLETPLLETPPEPLPETLDTAPLAPPEDISKDIENKEENEMPAPPEQPPRKHRPNYAAELPEPMQVGLVKLFTYVDKTNFAALGLIGVAALLFSVLSAIRKLEDNFNAVWCIKKGRNLLEQFSQYLIVLLLFPIAMLLTISMATFVHSGELAEMLHTSSPFVLWLGHHLGNLLMYLFLWGGFVFLYFYMPHTKVHILPALVGGFLGSLVWLAVLYIYLRWQVGLAKFNAIYGGFAALPFFLAWLYTSWIVVLLGAEICFAMQHIRLTRLTKHLPPPDPATNHLLGIAAMESICRHFDDGQGPWNAMTYAAAHAVALNELTAALDILARAKLVIQLTPNAEPPAQFDYIPVRPPAQITLAEVQEAFFGIEAGRAQEISQFLPEKLVTSLQNYHRENLRELSEINFGK